ncbi:hypothetical protein WBG78_24920, partial [Chryseolinea sp. T2]|uniref:hypothetical protein n=1 Tax=Chryseolinea sp. T2 TaxID=3129255 RepID=UPI0030777249
MAQLISGFQFTGSLGQLSAYRMKGSDKIVVRTKGGPSKSLIAKGKQFDITRRNNSEFGRRAKASAIVLNAMQPLRPLADYKISGAVNAILKQIQATDTTSTFGQRDIYLSRRPGLLEGFSFNRENTFDKALSAPVSVEVDHIANSVSVVIPEIVHGTNLRTSNRYPYCCFVVTAACVPDLIWHDAGYHVNVKVNTSETDWRSVTADAGEQRRLSSELCQGLKIHQLDTNMEEKKEE